MKKIITLILILGAAIGVYLKEGSAPLELHRDSSHSKKILDKQINQDPPAGNSHTVEQFFYQKELLERITELPTLHDLQNLTESEVHHTPTIILEGAKVIHEILEIAENDSTKREDTLIFFMKCSENQELAKAIRAQCFHEGTQAISRWDIFIPLSDYDIPSEIKTLATQIQH